MKQKLSPKLNFKFRDIEDIPELNVDTNMDTMSMSKKQIVIKKKKSPKKQQDAPTRLF